MPRTNMGLHPLRDPAPMRRAATVLLLRDREGQLEVLMTRRSTQASFAPGAFVFPGGTLDEHDHGAVVQSAVIKRADQTGQALADALAAVRESFEELGVLLARHPDGRWASAAEAASIARTPHDALSFYRQFMDGEGPTPGLATADSGLQATQGLRLAVDGVYPLAQWTTDRDFARRFDTAFLVARMPPDQQAVADEQEQFEPVWVSPQEALARHQQGRFFMIFPTVRTLERLCAYADVASVLRACAEQGGPLWESCPRAGLLGGQPARLMEHEAAFGELAMVCPDGQIVHALDWQTERPVPLLRNLQRLTCANPGVMTGPGTNSYLVGEEGSGYIVIDPGPVDAAHQQRLLEAAKGDIRAIVCTHSHPDHSPGAKPLQALCATRPPILGLPSAPTARAASFFTPDRPLKDGEDLVLHGPGGTHTLRVVHTPGHAANHLCLLLLEDGVLFSGDHVLNGSTTVVDPPDGDMSHYLASLDRLAAACDEHQAHFIAPAHGYVLGEAGGGSVRAIRKLQAHRLQREGKVRAAMHALPQGSLSDWVRLAYDDVPQRIWPVAERSLLAHVQRIRALEH